MQNEIVLDCSQLFPNRNHFTLQLNTVSPGIMFLLDFRADKHTVNSFLTLFSIGFGKP